MKSQRERASSDDDDDGVDVVKASDEEDDLGEPVSKRPRIENLRDACSFEDEDFVSTDPPSYDSTQPDGYCPWVKARHSTPTTPNQTQTQVILDHSGVVLDEEQRLSGEIVSPSLLDDEQFGCIGTPLPRHDSQHHHPAPGCSAPPTTTASIPVQAPSPEMCCTQFDAAALERSALQQEQDFGDPDDDDLLLGSIFISQECVPVASQESMSEEERRALDAMEQEAMQAKQVSAAQEESGGSFDSVDDAMLLNAAASSGGGKEFSSQDDALLLNAEANSGGGKEFSSQDDALLEQISLGDGRASQNVDDEDDRLLAAVDFEGILKQAAPPPPTVDKQAPGCSKSEEPVFNDEEEEEEDDAMMCMVADALEFSRDINDDSWDGD